MPHAAPLVATVASAFVMAFVFGTLAQRVRVSPLVGYLLAGVLVGPFTPGFVADPAMAAQLAEIGVILLMFGVGLHFSLKDLMEVKAVAVPGALAQIACVTGLGYAFGWALDWSPLNGFVFGLALSVASTVVVMRALEERRLLDTRRGRTAVGWLIVEDLAMVLALVLLPAVAGGGHADAGAGTVVVALSWTLVKVGAFVVVMMVVGKRAIPWVLEHVAATGSRELFTLCVLAIAVGVAFGAALLFDVSIALGAFFAGMLLNESELSHKAAADSLPLRDAFAVLFFVSVGMLFNPSILLVAPWLVLATVAIIVVGNALVVYATVRVLRQDHLTALTLALSLAQIGEFSFILAGLGLAQDMLSQQAHDLVLAGALISIIANPFLLGALLRWQARKIMVSAAPPGAEAPPGPPLQLDQHAIVIGYGRVGSALAGVLHERGVPVLVIDDDGEHVRRAHAAGIPALRGSAASDKVLAEAHPQTASIAILAIPQPLEAGETLAKLRALNPGLTLLARAHSDAEVKHLLRHGADGAVMAERELAHSLAEMVLATPPYRHLRHAADADAPPAPDDPDGGPPPLALA
jgi:CPA2 family monovalent cation:H+ antiporter-2